MCKGQEVAFSFYHFDLNYSAFYYFASHFIYNFFLFINSVICYVSSFRYLLIYFIIHLFIQSLSIYLVIYLLIYSFIHSLTHVLIHLLIYLFICLFLSLINSIFIYSYIYFTSNYSEFSPTSS